jgi:hypothetical protein
MAKNVHFYKQLKQVVAKIRFQKITIDSRRKMFQETTVKIIEKLNTLTQYKKSIIELDITNLNEQIQEALFTINFTQDTIDFEDFTELKKLNVTNKEALGLFFLAYTTSLKEELSYTSLWIGGIADALMDTQYNNNRFFIDNYFIDDSEPNQYLNEAIQEALKRFNLRDGYDKKAPSNTVLLQMGLLNRFRHLNLWLTSTSKQATIKELTTHSSENFSISFTQGWKALQRYSQSLTNKEQTLNILEKNIWFKEFNLDQLLLASKENLSSLLITRDDIQSDFFLSSVKFKNEELIFTLSGDHFYSLDLVDDEYEVFIDDNLRTRILKDETTKQYTLEESINIKQTSKSSINIEIRDTLDNTIYIEEFVLFDFNHDILIFDENGNYKRDKNDLLDASKSYCMLIDSDFETNSNEENIYEYFDGYVQLITNITKDSNFKADDGEEYSFELNFNSYIETPKWINHLELYTKKEFLVLGETTQYKLQYNKLSLSARKQDELIDINQDAKIVRWTNADGIVYDFDNDNFCADIEISEDILLNRINTVTLEFEGQTYTKRFNATILEQTEKPKYRTFLKDKNNNITQIKQSTKLSSQDIKDAQFISLVFHENIITNPQEKYRMIRDKSIFHGSFEFNRFFIIKNYPYYGEEISSVQKIYDDVRWSKICSIKRQGVVQEYNEKDAYALINNSKNHEDLSLIVLDDNYKISTSKIQIEENKIQIPSNIIGFCLVRDTQYLGSYFLRTDIDIALTFLDVKILKFLRFSYFPFGEFYNDTEYEKNRVLQQKARNDKKKVKKTIRETIKSNPNIFLTAFLEDELVIENLKLALNIHHSKIITEQILFAIVFDKELANKTIHNIILNRWQDKLIQLPMFLIYLLNITKDQRYTDIFLDLLPTNIEKPSDVDEDFINRMIKALLSDHKINSFEKINIKTITQKENRDFYIKEALSKCCKVETINEPEDEKDTAIG